jgi:predicted metalloprotease
MRWEGLRRSANVEDRRGRGVPIALGGGGIGIVVLALVAMFFGVDPSVILQDAGDSRYETAGQPASPEDDRLAEFSSAVLADTEDTWRGLFRQLGGDYREPTLVLYSGAAESACGFAQAAVGPFYCPGDEKLYLDLSFFRDMARKLQAPGDFAQAYVIAHEVGHHVQRLMGLTERVEQARRRASPEQANAISVRLELQADCFAGVWAHHADRTRNIVEPGDIDEALGAASAVGDDRLQMRSRGYVAPESFTHGTSEQRVSWFRRGYEAGRPQACDTFAQAR